MPRKRLFPPPAHPQTGKPLQNKGPAGHTVLTINGRITLARRRYAAPGVGSTHPLDAWLDKAEDSLSLGLRELACRLNLASRNFDKAAENLRRAAQVTILRDAIVAWKASRRGASRVKAAEQLLNYVTDRREMILYPKFQELGRQIGSGPTESMCKATAQRIKGCGRRWDGDNAEGVMALEALEQSGAWNAYWEMQLAQAV